ncbi:MAG: hypothetical protein ACXAD7_20210 [Candidatus Kariarchaeaceae archaeon]|jgi:hypothetical protein
MKKKQKYFASEYQITGWIALIGVFMAIAMVITALYFPEEATSLDRPNDPEKLKDTVRESELEALIFVTLDTFFIIGYTSLFIGMYLIMRDIHPLVSLIAISFGLITSLSDLIENALLFAFIKGVPLGWEPDTMFYVILWMVSYFIDSCSYVTAVLFGIMLVKSFPRGNNKSIIGILFLGYALIGFLAYLDLFFLLVRSFVFVIGLGFAAITLLREPEISLDDYHLLLSDSDEQNFT